MRRATTALTTVIALGLSACATTTTAAPDSSTPAVDEPGPDGSSTETPCTATTTGVDTVVAEDGPFPWDDADAAVLGGFDTTEVISGGPPPDGIRPLDAPCVVDVAGGDRWLADDESVLVVESDGEARAYPVAMMTQHEIVNDVLAGVPLVVTYCPLCNSGLAFERTVEAGEDAGAPGGVWDFGTSGRLLRSNLVMYDRQTRTLWSQFDGTALWGDPGIVGTELTRLPTQLLGWATFREVHPDGTVLGRASDPSRDYGRNPYPGYEDSPSTFLFRGQFDDTLDRDERVVGIGEGDDAVAVPLTVLSEQRALSVPTGERTVTVVWAPGQASALDAGTVAAGRDVGQTGAFLVDALEPLDDARWRDPATGAVHDVTGRTVEGDAPDLAPVPLDDTFWFVWFAFQPATSVAG